MNHFRKACLFLAVCLPGTVALAYTGIETRTLESSGIRSLSIRTYSGPLSITSTDGDNIEVEVVVDFNNDWNDDQARQALAEGLVLELERHGSRAELNSWVGDYDEGNTSFFTWGLIDLFRSGKDRPYSHLEVKVPRGIDLQINDFRGEVIIARYTGDIELKSGAGPIEISDITGDLDIEDGSGEIMVMGVTGDVEIRDGSGSMDVERIGGRLTIHDGGGEINVKTVGGLLDIRDGGGRIQVSDLDSDGEIYDGGGDIDVRRVKGSIAFTDGGGDIRVSDVGKDVIVYSRGGGKFNVKNVQGEVIDQVPGRRNYRDGEDRYNNRYNYRYRNNDNDNDIDEDIDIDVDSDVE